MDTTLLIASADMKKEYCAKIVRIGAMYPIEGADRLVQTFVDGNSIVVPKGMYEQGEAVVYCANECQINRNFLSANNLFDFTDRRLNGNHAEVEALLNEGREEEARSRVGFFNKQGRVKLIRLRGCPSYGCIFKKELLANWNPNLRNINLEEYLTTDENGIEHHYRFDTVDGRLFVQAYIPRTGQRKRKGISNKFNRRLLRFDRLIPGQFVYHYETDTLNGNMWRFRPETVVTISLKMHGTSVCLANVLTKVPVKVSVAGQKINRRLMRRQAAIGKQAVRFPWQRKEQERELERIQRQVVRAYRTDYGPVWSSRGVIKNRYINPGVTEGFYEVDIWSQYGEMMQPYISEGLTVYGEICGYLTGLDRMVMKNYDYGCRRGENFLMPYRITHTSPTGQKTEWSVMQVKEWTENLLRQHPDLQGRLRPIEVLYHGTLGDLYPTLDRKRFWHESVLAALKADTEHFGMEQEEPLCRNAVPREGICIRIAGDHTPQCFKLKTTAFFHRETKLIDQGILDYDNG